MFCSKCGAKLKDGAKFCEKCGEAVFRLNEEPLKAVEKKRVPSLVWVLLGVNIVVVIIIIVFIIIICMNDSKKETGKNPIENNSEHVIHAIVDEDESEDKNKDESDGESADESDAMKEEIVSLDSEALLQKKISELSQITLDGMKYEHLWNGSYYDSTGLAPTNGVFANNLVDWDGDGQLEILSFSLEYQSGDGNPYHNVILTVYEVEDNEVFASDKIVVSSLFRNCDDKGNFRVMLKDNKYLCIDNSVWCYLEEDGVEVTMLVLTYDGNTINTYANVVVDMWSEWEGGGRESMAFISKINTIGLTRTAYLMLDKDCYYFSTSDDGIVPLFKVRAELSGKYDDPVCTTILSMINGNKESDYILPDSARRVLDASEIEGLTKEQLRIARNEIYARYAWNFEDATLQSYFDSKAWYRENYYMYNITDNDLTEIERKNLNLIISAEK